jgi:hypothetical protein
VTIRRASTRRQAAHEEGAGGHVRCIDELGDDVRTWHPGQRDALVASNPRDPFRTDENRDPDCGFRR